MTWGAINEWTANAAYNRLATIADHPVLSELLGRIMRQEGRHAALYASWARDLLEDDRRAQKVTSWFLRHQWAPVGNGDVPKIETSFATAYLFGSGDGAELIDRIEERIDALPGLSGLNLVRTGIAEARDHVISEEGSVPLPPRAADVLIRQLVASRLIVLVPKRSIHAIGQAPHERHQQPGEAAMTIAHHDQRVPRRDRRARRTRATDRPPASRPGTPPSMR